MKGKIVRVMGDKMFGFIKGEDHEDYFFHASALRNESFTQDLVDRTVQFEESEGAKGLRAEEIWVD